MKRLIVSTAVFATALALSAQTSLAEQAKEDLKKNTTIGGCIITRAGYTDNDASNTKTDFGVRSVRGHIMGKILDFGYMLQLEYTGVAGTQREEGTHIVDAWIEWQKYPEFKVKIGQQKRAFTFENPYHPMDIGFGTYSQCVSFIGGYADKVGEQNSHGRDVGLAISGDLFPYNGHKFLHYHAGIYNGQGVNHNDKNKRKDLLAGLWVEPIEKLLVGIYGWSGDYVKADGTTLDRKRWSAGMQYESDWSARAEYIGDKDADGWYALVGAPLNNQFKVYGRWDVYRNTKHWDSTKTNYGLALAYKPCQYVQLQANYTYTHARLELDKNYNTFDIQAYIKF